jgi:hypothetical protein
MAGPTAPSGYRFSLSVFPASITTSSSASIDDGPPWTVYKRTAELIAQVQDAQGRPVENVPVVFEVAPEWQQDAEVIPSRVLTRQGRAQARFQSSLIGVVPVLARVENTTQQVTIAVSLPGDIRGSADGG